MGVKKGTKRGPYNKRRRSEKSHYKLTLQCKIENCPHPVFKQEHCWKHQDKIIFKNEVYCNICSCMIQQKNKSTMKNVCKDCIQFEGQKCKHCDNITTDFETGLCIQHKPSERCFEYDCTNQVLKGKMYCSKHNPENKCRHIIEEHVCGLPKSNTTKFCKKHGGINPRRCYDNDVSFCEFIVEPAQCGQKVPFIKKKDRHRVVHLDKCLEHGGGLMCDVCFVKLACFDESGCCEDHGGVKCTSCGGPMLNYSKFNICKNCNYQRRLEYDAKRRRIETITE